MNKISIGQAWSYATSFFTGQGVHHAIALIGVGIVVPLILQIAIGGGAVLSDPMSFATDGGMMAMGAFAILVGLLNYVLQTGSYFASWRIGLTGGAEPLGAALGYGLVAALPLLLLGFAVVAVLGLVAFLVFGSALAPMMMGEQPSQAAIAGTGMLLLLLMPLFFLFMLWLAARLCCTGPAMADRRTFNIFTGIGESWRMTAASQWKIIAYFILLGVAVSVIAMILTMIVGVSMFAGGGVPSGGAMVGIVAATLLLGIPMAYLQVGVLAGIYRALGQGGQGDVFA
ncbi:glycerophosphoryl diester phosphodiesterase membrane domain-containing protein [Sphingopyxis witflariensis]|uniref:Glycerophosphoryl diester phosphodiesterase membrane domain-containing protein n=1 Tax=Sphingopyxis witflariensis TaxID=173675 RepID=A0A246K4N5_9SPHN|nr:glycerophosphoryl diester phosphodiesterase membrane domain-containing protein [Sphingopyxis witflariensis]OWR00971.1 hypothetical protein CDQ91_00655 [Sphingopyxis witflariensis]